MRSWLILPGLVLAACVSEPNPEQVAAAAEAAAYVAPGPPPKMGNISGLLNDKAVAWETYDFSIGAYDASAWVGFSDGVQTLHLRGLPPGLPHSQTGEIIISGDITGARKPGPLSNVKVLLPLGDSADGPALSSTGQTALLQIDTIVAPSVDDSGYGRVAGRVTAALCPVEGAVAACRDLVASFDTEVQFDATQFQTAR